MNYLTRLAAQTGLTPDPMYGLSPAVSPSVGIEEIEVITSASAPVQDFEVLPAEKAQGVMAVSQAPVASEEAVDDLPPDPPLLPQDLQLSPVVSTVEDAPPSDAPDLIDETATAQSPDVTREILLQQVMGWVASNEQTLSAAPPDAEVTPDEPTPTVPTQPPATPDIRSNKTTPTPEGDIPSLQIEAPTAQPSAPPQEAPAAVQITPPGPPEPQPIHRDPAPAAPSIIEERIEISIGAIHLDVTPPPPTRAAPVAPPPAPAAPAPARASPSSRLARRFIRM